MTKQGTPLTDNGVGRHTASVSYHMEDRSTRGNGQSGTRVVITLK
ncbi:MAG: hypothetical protein R6U78_15865 [Bacteroidales bacterium]